ncbi:hypothetical protein [Chryseobacterium sp. MFBS3-17]|uniref:hypothetical protein n=1 Tax=Chryseobacterium sp. MFBS3-17 TaxID=2886689 RepID=UPI001D0F3024|nr:hypothetical protein [Chryseobacterium sp. MFBS3-17]MCC2591044.1 hypothetical protein [Chryseobacterium sp. MFBS3-17]
MTTDQDKSLNTGNSVLITKLTALWAVSESGLGGIFHAMKLPFTGLILGSFAVMIVTFMALNTRNKFRTILQATLIVVLVKAIASPHSPFTAYIAVLFQGMVGALIYALFPTNRFSAILYGVIALMESALQKLLMLVLIFGQNIWDAFQEFFEALSKQFHIESLAMFPMAVVGIYCCMYFIGGILAGNFAIMLPEAIRRKADALPSLAEPLENDTGPRKKKGKTTRLLTLLMISMFIASVFLFTGSVNKALWSLARTFAAIGLLFFIINPLFKYFMERWKKSRRHHTAVTAVLDYVPQFRSHAAQARLLAEQEKSAFRKFRTFLLTWMALALYTGDETGNHHQD